MSNIYPWQKTQWQQVVNNFHQQRLAHAVLLLGAPGMGKLHFAQNLANLLLCQQAGDYACGQCKACLLFKSHTHPDFAIVQPSDNGKQIAIQQIRQLIEFANLTSTYGKHKVIIINPAEAMNRNSANALLKLLEEPPGGTILLLLSHQPLQLLATIRSRCVKLSFPPPTITSAINWLRSQTHSEYDLELILNLAHGAPLMAQQLLQQEVLPQRKILFTSLLQLINKNQSPIEIAQTWQNQSPAQLIHWMWLWTVDLIRYIMSGQQQIISNTDSLDALQFVAQKVELKALFNLLDLQVEALRLLNSTANIKSQAVLEQLALAWYKLTN